MSDAAADDSSDSPVNLTGSAAITVLASAALAWTSRSGATALLIAVAALQALMAFAWVLTLNVPGRNGALLIAGLSAAGADVAVSRYPDARLAPLLAVVGLAVPVLFVHQLTRGAARVRVLESLGAISLLVVAEAALPALLQLRHEFPSATLHGDVVFGVVVAAAGALLVGYFTDMIVPSPRFDADVPRGLLAVLASTVVGAAIGHLTLRSAPSFGNGRAAFAGAAIGVLIAFLAVAIAFIETGTPLPEAGFARRARPVLSALVPFSLLCPGALLLCLVIAD